MSSFPFGGFGRHHDYGYSQRPFGRGDLKYVVLELLNEQPRHGYDIIRALETRMRGRYRPSPGSVYPTLQMLEDLGYVTSTQMGGKKVYTITNEGHAYLEEQTPTLEDIRSRIAAGWDAATRPEVADILRDLQGLAGALLDLGLRGALNDPDVLKDVRGTLERTHAQINEIARKSPSNRPGPRGPDTRMI